MSTCCKDGQAENTGCCSNATTAVTSSTPTSHQAGGHCCQDDAS